MFLFRILDVLNNFMFPTMGEQSKVGKFSEINKQFHVKSWLTYRSDSFVCMPISSVAIEVAMSQPIQNSILLLTTMIIANGKDVAFMF